MPRPHRVPVIESDLCIALGHHYSRRGYEIYPELSSDLTLYHRGRDELIGIEAKRDLNFKVLHQALQRVRVSGFDAVLIATTGSTTSRFWAPKICAHPEVGLGVIVVSRASPYDIGIWGEPVVEILQRATRKLHYGRRDRILDLMCPEASSYATPGDTGPQGFSPFRMQEVTLYRAIKELGPQGISLGEALAMLGKKVRKDRLLELFKNKVFGSLALEGERITIRAPWGSKEAGHNGIQWAPVSSPDLAAGPSELVLLPPS